MTTPRCWGKGPPASQHLMNNHFKRETTLMMYHWSFCPVMGNRDSYHDKITLRNRSLSFIWVFWVFLFACEHKSIVSSVPLIEKVWGRKSRWLMWLHGPFLPSLLHLEEWEKSPAGWHGTRVTFCAWHCCPAGQISPRFIALPLQFFQQGRPVTGTRSAHRGN